MRPRWLEDSGVLNAMRGCLAAGSGLLGGHESGRSSGELKAGSLSLMKGRTFSSDFGLTFLTDRHEKLSKPKKLYGNPMALAQEWQQLLESRAAASRAELARQLGVSRAHVTQVCRVRVPCATQGGTWWSHHW